MHDLLRASAVELARAIRDREVTSAEVVDVHIRRIEEVNPLINAVVAQRFDQARTEAAAADKMAKGKRADRPLHGVPCTIKEFFAVEGMPWTAGLRARAGVIAERDATVVARLKRAGAIVLGVTNGPEGGLWYETNNLLYGRTSNPWDLHRTPGGSSGGEGAILAAGGSPFGLGSDTGGSIRIPAALCGIAGHKPTGGLVPATGHFPHPPSGTPIMSCGPMARDVGDLPLLLKLIAGPDGEDEQVGGWTLGDPDAVDLSEVVVHTVPGNGRAFVRAEVGAAVKAAGAMLADRGAQAAELSAPDLGRSLEIWAAKLGEVADRYDHVVGDGKPVPVYRELLKWPLGRSNHTASVLLILALERLLDALPGKQAELAPLAARLCDHLEAGLGPNGVMLHPVVSRTAPRHRGMLLQSPFDVSLTTAFNVTTLPVTVVPVGRDSRGLPIGVQVVARRGNDHLCLAVGAALQDAFGKLGPVDPTWGPRAPLGLRLV